jgi:ribose transport system ATP-binding protein
MSHLDKKHLEYVLELENITKQFPGVKALDNVTVRLRPGEVLAICGENGAGKSTLINCISGVFVPEEGIIKVDGVVVTMKNPQAAFSKGISVVHQERNLISTFDVAENIFFNKVCGSAFGIIDKKEMINKTKDLLKRVKLNLKPTDSIEDLSSGQKQLIEIARALSINSHILLLDEPTASISIKESDMLLDTIRELRAQGVAIIYISHKLEEVFAIADRVKVIRDGKTVGEEVAIDKIDRDKLIEMMVGSRELKQNFPTHDRSNEPVVLEVKGITSQKNHKPASFKLHKGEILGWYGLVGAGRTELAREIIGIDPIKNGQLIINGKACKIRSYKDALENHKIYYLSENRKEEGLFCSHKITTNISIIDLKKIKNKAKLNSYKKETELAQKYRELLKIKTSSTENIISSLSGGNQQKVCVAKCLHVDPQIIFIDEPTVGIDIKTKGEIHKLIYELSQQGKSIVLISSDLPELIQMSERILVFNDGRILGEIENEKEYNKMSSMVMEAILKS